MDEIFSYLNDKLNTKNYAKKFYAKLLETIDEISESPNIFPIYENKSLNNPIIRRAIIDNYALFYTIDDKSVKILRILYARKNIEEIIKKM